MGIESVPPIANQKNYTEELGHPGRSRRVNTKVNEMRNLIAVAEQNCREGNVGVGGGTGPGCKVQALPHTDIGYFQLRDMYNNSPRNMQKNAKKKDSQKIHKNTKTQKNATCHNDFHWAKKANLQKKCQSWNLHICPIFDPKTFESKFLGAWW